MKLKRMRVENFMGCHSNEFAFSENGSIVSGKNGTGKSTIGNAWMWLVVGTDQNLKDNPVVRREINGEPVNDMDVIVEAVVDCDGIDMTFRKVQKRTFNKDGISYKDDNKYFVNEVPVTLKTYNEKIGIDIGILKQATNLQAFISLAPKEMRKAIFGMVEDVEDIDVAKKYGNQIIVDEMEKGYSTEEIRAMATMTKSKSQKEISILDGMIMEAERNATIEVDTSELEEKLNSLKKELKEKQEKLSKQKKSMNLDNKKLMDLNFEKTEMEKSATQKLMNQRDEFRNQADIHKEKYMESKAKYDSKKEKINSLAATYNSLKRKVDELSVTHEKLLNTTSNIEERREIERMFFTEDTCPTCGRKLPKSKLEQLQADFYAKKEKMLSDWDAKQERDREERKKTMSIITEEISKTKNEALDAKEERERLLKEIEGMDNSLLEMKDDYIIASKKAESIDVFHPDLSDDFNYQILLKKIKFCEKNISNGTDLYNSIMDDIYETNRKISEISLEIKQSDRSEFIDRYNSLIEDKKRNVKNKIEAEKILDALDELDKAKNEYLTDAINSHFSKVKWQMFDYAKNGNYKSVCIPKIEDKEILTIKCNKVLRLQGLIDICASIQKYYNIDVPIFIDDFEAFDSNNAEEVISCCDRQIICMKVSDENLKVEEIQK